MLVVWRVGEAYWVDELPAADFQRTRVTRNAPRVERSDRTCTPNPHQEQGLPSQHSPKSAPHNKTPIKVRGSDYRTRRLP